MDFLLAIGALAALTWIVVVFLRGGLLGGALLVLLAGSCFGLPFFNIQTGPVPLTADRALLGLLLVQYLVYRRWGWTEPKPLTTTDYVFFAFLTAITLSTLVHDFRWHNAQPLSQLVFFYLMPAVMYWIARQTPLSERTAQWLFSSLAIFGIYLCITAIAETQQAWAFVFPRYIASAEYREFFGRGRGPFLNPAGVGFFLSVGLVASLLWWPRLNRTGQLALLLTMLPLFALGAYCTLTRSVWMGVLAGLAIVLALSLPRGWRAVTLGTLVLASVLGVAATWEQLNAFKRDKELSVEAMAESARLRPILATVAWYMFLDRPVLGCGFGQYIEESRPYLSDRSSDLPLERTRPYVQHNVFLGLLTETGALGMGLFIALLACWARDAWRVWRSLAAPLWARQCALLLLAVLAIYLPNAMFHNVALIPMFNMLLFFVAGIGAAVAPLASPDRYAAGQLRLWLPATASR